MILEFENFKQIERLLRFMMNDDFQFSPYAAYCILNQSPNATIVKTYHEWKIKGVKIRDGAKPIIVPLPVSTKKCVVNGKTVSIYSLSELERQKILEENIEIKEKMEYVDFKFFSDEEAFEIIYSDSLFETSIPAFENQDDLLEQLEIILSKEFEVETEKCNIGKMDIKPFYSLEKNKIFVEDINAKSILIGIVDMVLKLTSTQTAEILEFERELLLFFLFDKLPVKNEGIGNLERAFYMSCNELDLTKSITRCVKMFKYICSFFEVEEIEEKENKGLFKNRKVK